MSQHLGAPCIPTVAKGDRVVRGQLIGTVDAMISAPIHSPVTGEVADIRPALTTGGARVLSVFITPDAEQDLEGFQVIEPPHEGLPDVVRAAGVVGMGGAAFPASVKLQPPKPYSIDTVILNGCECEPFLTCDDRLMVEQPDRVIQGGIYIAAEVGAARIVVAIEDNKPEAIKALRRAASGTSVEVVSLKTHYPQGAEKQLIYAITGRVVQRGQLPASASVLVHNVGTAAALADAVDLRKPVMDRVVTVTGAVNKPGNYLVLVGTSVAALLEAAGGFSGPVGRIISGGPMTGQPLASLDVPVVKGTSGIVVLTPEESAPMVEGDQACIRCGRCIEACPMLLHPYGIASHADLRNWDGVESYSGLDCIECGACSYVCPTRRPLVQLIKSGKAALMTKGVKK